MNQPWLGEFFTKECEKIEQEIKFYDPDQEMKMMFAGMFITMCRLRLALRKDFEVKNE